jgi:hypothetical protein
MLGSGDIRTHSVSVDSNNDIVVVGDYYPSGITFYNASGAAIINFNNEGDQDGFMVKYSWSGFNFSVSALSENPISTSINPVHLVSRILLFVSESGLEVWN